MSLQAQINTDFLIPNFNIGMGLKEMKDISVATGFGYDVGYDFPESSFGISAFYNFSRYGRVLENLPMYREEYGEDIVGVRNISRVSSYGVKFRYIPFIEQQTRFLPYAEVGAGFATHTSLWKSKGRKYQTGFDPECPKYAYEFKHRGIMDRNTTLIGLAEIGLNIRLDGMTYYILDDLFVDRLKNRFRTGWYLSLSVRYEHGGKVSYNHPKAYKHEFYYDSGLGIEYDTPFSATKSIDLIREPRTPNRHQMLFFQIGIAKTIF